jgi:poly(3-hydroxybutyrate) depolymerase
MTRTKHLPEADGCSRQGGPARAPGLRPQTLLTTLAVAVSAALALSACSGGGGGSTAVSGTVGGSSSGGGSSTGSGSGGSTGSSGGSGSGSSGGTTQPPPPSSFALNGTPAVVTASDCATVTGDSGCTANWPTTGSVYLYRFTETRGGSSQTLAREAYVYKPAGITGGSAYPALFFLHGGTQSGEQMFGVLPFAQLADGRSLTSPVGWYENTSGCQEDPLGSASLGLGGTSQSGFIDGNGAECTPNGVQYYRPLAAGPFYVIYPDGIEDYDQKGRSWEDGRTPSPGQYQTQTVSDWNTQYRDDVGFVNALIATLKSQEGSSVDATRIYLAGMSNGGFMTERVMCNVDNPAYPQLAGIAAFSVSIGSMADDLYLGANGRETCPSSGTSTAPLSIFVGYGSPTPDAPPTGPFQSGCYPYNTAVQPCDYSGRPPVSGDSVIPYGSAGEVHTINSPSLGQALSGPDNQSFWLNYFEQSGAGTATATTASLGYFTTVTRYTFASSPLVFQVYTTDHGLHANLGSRFDFSPAARIYDFLFSFSKSNGTVSNLAGSYNAATGRYGNLRGTY